MILLGISLKHLIIYYEQSIHLKILNVITPHSIICTNEEKPFNFNIILICIKTNMVEGIQ